MPNATPEPPHDAASLNREKARLRLAGVIVLSLGLISAGLVYWFGTRAEKSRVDQYEDAVARSEARQMQLLYGKSGGLLQDTLNGLKQPANQAILIAAVSGIIAAGCFYLGRPLPEDDGSQE